MGYSIIYSLVANDVEHIKYIKSMSINAEVHHEIRSKTNDNPQTLDISLRARRTPLLPGRLAIES